MKPVKAFVDHIRWGVALAAPVMLLACGGDGDGKEPSGGRGGSAVAGASGGGGGSAGAIAGAGGGGAAGAAAGSGGGTTAGTGGGAVPGRPLHVDDDARLAVVIARGDWC